MHSYIYVYLFFQYYLHPHRDAAGIMKAAGMHLIIEHCQQSDSVSMGKLMAPQLEHSTLNVPTLEYYENC